MKAIKKLGSSLTVIAFTLLMSVRTSEGAPNVGDIITQTNYNAQNFAVDAGYVRAWGITTTNQPANLRWQGNDTNYNPATFQGQTDLISRVQGYSIAPSLAAPFNSSLIQGGLGGALPATNNVRIWDDVNSPTNLTYKMRSDSTVRFFAEWSIVGSTPADIPYTNNDTFSFDLRNAANTASLLKLQFTPGIQLLTNFPAYTLQTFAAGAPTGTVIDLAYGALFQMQVDMVTNSYSITVTRLDPGTRAVITNYPNIVSNASLASGFSAFDFGTLGVNWELASGDPTLPGANYILANQFEVTTTGTVIPEPGTWAASLLLLGIGGSYLYRSKKRRLSAAA